MKKLAKQIYRYLEIKGSKKEYLQVLINAAMILTHDILEDDDDLTNKTYLYSCDRISTFFEINAEQLHTIIDILTSNPYLIFDFEDTLPEINIDTLQVKGKFNESRLVLLCEALRLSIREVRELSAIWLYNQELLTKGERYLEKIAKDLFNISPKVLKILVKSHGVLTSKIRKEGIRDAVPGLVIEQLKLMREEIKEQDTDHYEFPWMKSKFMKVFTNKLDDVNEELNIPDSKFKSPFMNTQDITPLMMVDFSIKIAELVMGTNVPIFKEILDGDDIGELLCYVYRIFTGRTEACINALLFI